MKPRMTKNEHAAYGKILKQRIGDLSTEYLFLTRLYPSNDRIVKRAEKTIKELSELASLLDDEICRFPFDQVPDATNYYFPFDRDSYDQFNSFGDYLNLKIEGEKY